jgi:hypothetical protein
MRERNLISSFVLAVIAVLALTVQARIAGQTKPATSYGTGLPQSVRLYVFDCGATHGPAGAVGV